MTALRIPLLQSVLTRSVRAVTRRGGAPTPGCGRTALPAAADCSFARAHSHEKPACIASLPAETASTVVTVRPARGACRRRPISASALHAPMQRVQVISSPIA